MSDDYDLIGMAATDDTWGVHLGNQVLVTHPPTRCEGSACVIHNPTEHHMRGWATLYRADRGMTERTCPHGVGHPDPDDLAWHVSEGRAWQGVHGCDGCCSIDPEKRRP